MVSNVEELVRSYEGISQKLHRWFSVERFG